MHDLSTIKHPNHKAQLGASSNLKEGAQRLDFDSIVGYADEAGTWVRIQLNDIGETVIELGVAEIEDLIRDLEEAADEARIAYVESGYDE